MIRTVSGSTARRIPLITASGADGGAAAATLGSAEGAAGGSGAGGGGAVVGAAGITASSARSCAGTCFACRLVGYCDASDRSSRIAASLSCASRNRLNASIDTLDARHNASSA